MKEVQQSATRIIKKLITLVLILAMTVTSVAVYAEEGMPSEDVASYQELIFDTSRVHMLEITMAEEDRVDQLENPTEKTKYKADLVIDGESVPNVAFHTKGNSSLYFTAAAGKDKFSYGISFTACEEGRTYHGLNKLNLQNNFSDATLAKEYMAFWMFRSMGIAAPLASYAWLTVNGEPQGIYTVLEDVGSSFLERTSDATGTLYKPEAETLALNDEELERLMDGDSAAHDDAHGADLVYRDDSEESYPDIFTNCETGDDEQTRASVILALKALSEKTDLDRYLDTAEIIKYFAVHNFLVNYDSYTGPMLHNYYLYWHNGLLSMLPWDYDSAFGEFPADGIVGSEINSSDIVNTGIESPLGGIPDEARPMWSWILSDRRYLKAYHDTLAQVTEIIDSGEYEAEAAAICELILPFTEKDPKAFFTLEEVCEAHATMLQFTELRAESICRQLQGQLAARSENQDEKDRVDASEISIRAMGRLPVQVG